MSYWVGINITKQLESFMNEDPNYVPVLDITDPKFKIWCPSCGNNLYDELYYTKDCVTVLLNSYFPMYCPVCGAYHGRNILDNETNTTYFIRPQVAIKKVKHTEEEDEENIGRCKEES